MILPERVRRIVALLLLAVAVPPGCAMGTRDAEAQFQRAQEYAYSGQFERAAKWYRRAGDQGHPGAQFSLSQLYEWGAGVPQNYDDMVTWSTMAAEQGNADAQFVLGLVHTRAMKWGHGLGGHHATRWDRVLGALDGTGVGFAQDDVQAYMWFTLAADQGHSLAWKHAWVLDQRLSPTQIAAARQRVADWQPARS